MDNYFDKIFIINLDHRTDRWKQSLLELQKFNIKNYERFSAIKPNLKELPKNYYDRLEVPSRLDTYKIGAMGCKLSHYEVIKLSKQRNYKNILILEDDFKIEDDFISIFNKGISDLTFDWHMLYLGGNNNQKPQKLNNSKIIHKCIETATTHAYAINFKVFDLCIKMMLNSGCEIDVFYKKLQKKFKIYCFYPSIIKQRESESDIFVGQKMNYIFK